MSGLTCTNNFLDLGSNIRLANGVEHSQMNTGMLA